MLFVVLFGVVVLCGGLWLLFGFLMFMCCVWMRYVSFRFVSFYFHVCVASIRLVLLRNVCFVSCWCCVVVLL